MSSLFLSLENLFESTPQQKSEVKRNGSTIFLKRSAKDRVKPVDDQAGVTWNISKLGDQGVQTIRPTSGQPAVHVILRKARGE